MRLADTSSLKDGRGVIKNLQDIMKRSIQKFLSNWASAEVCDALVAHSINSRELLGEVHHEGHDQLLPVHRGADLGKDQTQDVLKHLGSCFRS